jgi:ATP-dependent protease HslVU (ClpYQ) peptidase subunit
VVVCAKDQSDGVLWSHAVLEYLPLASAILLFYTSDGFLIAADGRARIGGVVVSDVTRKIFSISESRRSLAYAFGGSAALTDKDDSDIILFDFREEANKAIKSLRKDWHENLRIYANKLAKRVQNRLENALQNDRIEPLKADPTGLVAALFIAGYYAKTPSMVIVQFKADGHTLIPPDIREVVNPEKGYMPLVTYASEVVRQELFLTDNPKFSKYRIPRIHSPNLVTLSEVERVATNYISACADPVAMAIDPEHCAAIGGHIHIAKITARDGFDWEIPPAEI